MQELSDWRSFDTLWYWVIFVDILKNDITYSQPYLALAILTSS